MSYHSGASFQGHNVSGGNMVLLQQNRYDRGQLIPEECRIPSIHYGGHSLGEALNGDTRNLANPGGLTWPASCKTPQKLAIALCFVGYTVHTHQVTLLRTCGIPPLREKLAHVIAVEVQHFLNKARDVDQRPLCFHGRPLTLDDLVLLDVVHVSKGTLQPVIAVVNRNRTSHGPMAVQYPSSATGFPR
ncbi:hypothetical protein C8Q76DRAFT_789708 [Earliella scabrosa]|nr:hypothetical protein C8Q76DRAFT_789708 [Earliella scabrosa]